MASIYIYKYNNDFNGIVKKEDTLAAYGNPLYSEAQVNFNPNDGANTVFVAGRNNHSYLGGGDYLIYSEDNSSITSRWFIIEDTRTRLGQAQLTLLRDVMVDYNDSILNSTCFINKGYVPQTSPFIFNNENMGFNQIKKSETLLKNKLGTPWVVAYLSRYDGEGNYNSFKGSFKSAALDKVDYTLNSLDDYKYNTAGARGYRYVNTLPAFTTFYNANSKGYITYATSPAEIVNTEFSSTVTGPTVTKPIDVPASVYNDIKASYDAGVELNPNLDNLPWNTYTTTGTQAGADLLAAENGKIIKVGDKYYRIRINYGTVDISAISGIWGISVPSTSALGMTMTSKFFPSDNPIVSGTPNHLVKVPNSVPNITISYLQVDRASLNYEITYDGTYTRDAVYEIIGTPLYNVTFNIDSTTPFTHDGDIGLEWFQDIANRYRASGYCMDVQIVPYAPIDTTDISSEKYFLCGGTLTNAAAIGFKFPTSSFTVANTVSIPLRDDKKIGNECDLFRFCSPNGVGDFDFNPYKNGGFASFEADVTLLPINPYIKIHPIWNNLYGNGSIEDFRGLICGGDFSIGNTSNEWLTYQQQNKFYQDIFNRDIESQEVNNNITREREKWQVATGAIGGVLSGATAGGLIGGSAGIIGSVIGGALGGAASLAGGMKDIELNERQRSEAIELQKDQFGYQLGTIKARTTQLSKTTAFNINNKYFPYVEYWTCTEEEVEALKNKIKYNGMTVGVIGKLSDYIGQEQTFVQAQLIEIDIMDDTHVAAVIARKLSQGVRI